jgi:hypothetical protein
VFDLTLLPINFVANQEQTDLPGLVAANAPRRVARGRAGDQLIGLLTLSIPAIIPPNEMRQLMNRMAQAYFETPGSVTAGLRGAADHINQAIIDRNLRAPVSGQVNGSLNLAVIHGNALFLAHGGTTYTFLLYGQTADVYSDVQPAGKALGLAKPIPLRFYQASLEPGAELIFCPEPPVTWNANTLAGGAKLALDQLLQRLLLRHSTDFACGVVQLQPGVGRIAEVRAQPNPLGKTPVLVGKPVNRAADVPLPPLPDVPQGEEPPAAPEPQPVEPAPQPDASDTVQQVASEPIEDTTTGDEPAPVAPAPAATQPVQTVPPAVPPTPGRSAPSKPASIPTPPPAKKPLHADQPKPAGFPGDSGLQKRKSLLPWIARLWRGGRKIQRGSAQATGSFLEQLLPGQADQPGSLSRGTMVFIAIAIPLIIVAVATTVYKQRGLGQYYEQYYAAAMQAAQKAQTQTDPQVVRGYWEETLRQVQTAEPIKNTDELKALRTQAQDALDQMDGITRLDFSPAVVGGLAETVKVIGIVASGSDMYLLDGSKGNVLRATLTGQGYEVDSTFRCDPGPSGTTDVGALIGMVAMPKGNEFKAAVMGMDATGNILYCIPGESPLATTLQQPDKKWEKVAAISYDSDNLYVLDPANNAIWVYSGSNGTFKDRPALFFEKDAPPMADAVDLAINNTDLYLLHGDGHITFCTLSLVATSPTRCSEPAELSDPRPNHPSPVPVIENTQFTHMLYTNPPDPSIYLLDVKSGSIFHFSLRLNLQSQMRGGTNPTFSLPTSSATAFTISPNRTAFLAFGNQVFYGLIP